MATSRAKGPPQDITPGVLVLCPLAFVAAEWWGFPGVPGIWLVALFAVWIMNPPELGGKRDASGYATPANPAESKKLARFQTGRALRRTLFLPWRDILPGWPIRAAWVSALVTGMVAFFIPVAGNKHITSANGRWVNVLFAVVLVLATTGSSRRTKGPDNPGVLFDTWGAFRTSRNIVLIALTIIVGAAAGLAGAYELIVLDTRYGSGFGVKRLHEPLVHTGLFLTHTTLMMIALAFAGGWFTLLMSWRKSATKQYVDLTAARSTWNYRWMSLKYEVTPVVVDHRVLGDGVNIDTLDAPAHLGAVEFLKNEARLAPLLNPGERVALLSTGDEGMPPGSRSAVRFVAVTWSQTYDVTDPSATTELVTLWAQSGLAWVSHGRGVPQEPMPREVIEVGSILDDTEVQHDEKPTLRMRLSEFWRQVKAASPTESTLYAALHADEVAQPDAAPVVEDDYDDNEEDNDDIYAFLHRRRGTGAPPEPTPASTPLPAPVVASANTPSSRLWQTKWYYSDVTIGAEVFRDSALGELREAMQTDVLIDHRVEGVIFIGDLDGEVSDESGKALDKVRTEDKWRQIWTSSVKTGANLPIPQISTVVEKKLENGAVMNRMAFVVNTGNEPLEYKYPGVEKKLASALGIGRSSGATFVAVTGYPARDGRPGDRHPQALFVLWSFDPVPRTPTMLKQKSEADQWLLAGLMNDTFTALKLPHPEVFDVRCLTKPTAAGQAWEVHLRLYGAVTTGVVRSAASKISDILATPWVRVTDAPDGCVLYLGVEPDDADLVSPDDAALVASLDWEQAFLVSHVVGNGGSVPVLTSVSHMPSNPQVKVLEFELPPGLDKMLVKMNAGKLRTATGNSYLNIAESQSGPTFITVQASRENPLGLMIPFDFEAADDTEGFAFATGVDGEPVEFDPASDIHLAVIGMTGSGKSVAGQAILYGAAIKGYEIVVVDPSKGAADFRFLEPYARAMVTNVHDAAATLKAIYAEVERRKDLNSVHATASIYDLPDDVRPAPILVFIDEFTSLIATGAKVSVRPSDDPELERERLAQRRMSDDRMAIAIYTGKLAREARSAGVTVVLGTQKLMAKSLENIPDSGDLKTNLSRLLLGQTSQGDRMSALRQFEQAPDPGDEVPKGRGIFESASRTGVLIQAWLASPTQLAEALAERLLPLTEDQLLDVSGFRSRLVMDTNIISVTEREEIIDLGEMEFSLEESEESESIDVDAVTTTPITPAWDIDWSTPVPQPDDPFAPRQPRVPIPIDDDDPFA
jgi:hypothetical protein